MGDQLNMFTSRTDEKRAAAIRQLKLFARKLFNASDDDAVVVTELACTEPGCPPVETVVALLRAGSQPRQVKVHKPAIDVTLEDVKRALGAEHDH